MYVPESPYVFGTKEFWSKREAFRTNEPEAVVAPVALARKTQRQWVLIGERRLSGLDVMKQP